MLLRTLNPARKLVLGWEAAANNRERRWRIRALRIQGKLGTVVAI